MCRALLKTSHKNVEEIYGETSRFTAPADEVMSRLPVLRSLLYKRDLYVWGSLMKETYKCRALL